MMKIPLCFSQLFFVIQWWFQRMHLKKCHRQFFCKTIKCRAVTQRTYDSYGRIFLENTQAPPGHILNSISLQKYSKLANRQHTCVWITLSHSPVISIINLANFRTYSYGSFIIVKLGKKWLNLFGSSYNKCLG